MSALVSPQQRKTLFYVILFVAFCAFTTDIVDLREELQILSCPFGCPDNDFTSGIKIVTLVGHTPASDLRRGMESSSVTISFLHLLQYTLRAPPPLS